MKNSIASLAVTVALLLPATGRAGSPCTEAHLGVAGDSSGVLRIRGDELAPSIQYASGYAGNTLEIMFPAGDCRFTGPQRRVCAHDEGRIAIKAWIFDATGKMVDYWTVDKVNVTAIGPTVSVEIRDATGLRRELKQNCR